METKRTIHRPSITEQIVEHSNGEGKQVDDNHLFVPTGSALLNLALSDRCDGGFLTGKIANVIGDASSGKTFQALTLLAETAHNPAFDNYLLVYDDAEAANEFNIEKLFGPKTADRILPPSLTPDEPGHSHTMMDFQSNVRRLLNGGKPFVYVQDSFDALTTDEELKHAADLQKAHDSGKETKGSYGMEKAKQASILLRLIASEVKSTQSLVIIISQTRDNIDPMSFQKRTRAGGKALYFYCSYEIWLAVAQKLSTKIHDKSRNIGVVSRVKVTKNKFNGKTREISLKMFYSYGIDDIGSCIDFLVEENYWHKNANGGIDAVEFKTTASSNKLIDLIEKNKWIEKLHSICQTVWLDIEHSLILKRIPKYS